MLIDTENILLGRPWMNDKNGIHGSVTIHICLFTMEKLLALHPLKSVPLKKGSRAGSTKESFKVCHVYRGNENRI